MKLMAENIHIRPLQLDDVDNLFRLRSQNREFFRPFEPRRPDSYFTLEEQRRVIEISIQNWQSYRDFSFGIIHNHTNSLIGRVNLSNVVWSAWRSCTIGYYLDQKWNGHGYMTEAVKLAIEFAFNQVDLHRVQAGIMPNNLASIRVVEKVGFHYEGLAKYYLKIDGKWEDHKIYSITKEYWE